MKFKNILVLTDFSEISAAAFSVASQIAEDSNGQLNLVNVLQDWVVPPTVIDQVPLPDRIDEYREEIYKSTSKKLKDLAAQKFPNQKINAEVILTVRSDAAEIIDYAHKHNCDLIVLTGRGRGAVTAALLGSVTQKVISLASCPVLVVPASTQK